MRIRRTVSAAAAAALCALGLAAGVAAATAPANPVKDGQATAGGYASPRERRAVTIPHGADREDVLVVASDPALIQGRRWAAEVHRIAQSMTTSAGRSEGVSFAWRDAGAGALATLGLVALLGVAAYGLRSRAARTTSRGA